MTQAPFFFGIMFISDLIWSDFCPTWAVGCYTVFFPFMSPFSEWEGIQVQNTITVRSWRGEKGWNCEFVGERRRCFLIECLVGGMEASRRLSLPGFAYGEGGRLVLRTWMKHMMSGDAGLESEFACQVFCLQGEVFLKEKLCP